MHLLRTLLKPGKEGGTIVRAFPSTYTFHLACLRARLSTFSTNMYVTSLIDCFTSISVHVRYLYPRSMTNSKYSYAVRVQNFLFFSFYFSISNVKNNKRLSLRLISLARYRDC